MAAICKVEPPPILHYRRHLRGNHNQGGTFRCSASAQGNHNRETPQLLRTAVSGVTEFLRLLSPKKKSEICEGKEVPLVCGIDDVVSVLRSDYEQAYFLTGNFTSEIYSENCLFEDPTIKFRGKALYLQNLELLVPFFDLPSLALENIEQVVNNEKTFVLTSWKLRTYLKLPWRPLISIDGTTIYDLDEKCKIVRHVESWNISAFEAVGQIFKPSGRV